MTQNYKKMIEKEDLTSLNIDHLNTCIKVMKRVDDKDYKFDMSFWQGVNGITKKTEAELHTCGTAACFGGWLSVSPEFIEAGGHYSKTINAPKYKQYIGDEAIRQYLGLKKSNCIYVLSRYLCGITNHPVFYGKPLISITAKDVLIRLQYIKTRYQCKA